MTTASAQRRPDAPTAAAVRAGRPIVVPMQPPHSGARIGALAASTQAADAPVPRDAMERVLLSADIRVLRAGRESLARPWDLLLHDERLAKRVRRNVLVGLGDAYVDGWWDCAALDQFFDRAISADLPAKLSGHPRVILDYLNQRLRNLQNRPHARSNVERHYNLGNDVFEATLDHYMQYTCGYWAGAGNLSQAQEAKLDLVCRKLGLQPGMRVLDLGCGWGGLARFAMERFGVSVVGVTLSIEQKTYAENFCTGLPLEVRLHDYRETQGVYDRVTSIGMFEHVGPKNHRAAMRVIHRCLAEDGLALLQFFATRDSFPNRTHPEVMWINKHIFPGLVVPSLGQIGDAIDNLFVLEDLHNFGADYDPTLMAWADNFTRHWPGLAPKYGGRFYRTWRYYLLSCAGAFRARDYQLWQLVLSKHGVRGGYTSIR